MKDRGTAIKNTLFPPEVLGATCTLIFLSDGILLAPGEKPDVDSSASAFAFREFIRKFFTSQNKEIPPIHIYAPNVPEENTLFERILPTGNPYTEIETALPSEFTPDLIVGFDYGSYARLQLPIQPDGVNTCFVGIDHHPVPSGFQKGSRGFEIQDPAAPSTTAMLYRLFQRLGFPVTPEIADCLLVGLLADTGRYGNKLTNREAHAVTEELIGLGANYQAAIECMKPRISHAAFKAQLLAREHVTVYESVGLGFLYFSRDDLRTWGVSSAKEILPLFGTLQSIQGVHIAAACYEQEDGSWYCSLRGISKNGKTAEIIAKALGGGGHEDSAAFTSNEPSTAIFQKLHRVVSSQ